MIGTFQQAAVIVVLGIALGLVGNLASPRGLPLITPAKAVASTDGSITLAQANELWLGGVALFLDAREPDDYAAGHIGNALSLPAQSFEQRFGAIAPMLTPESRLVLYCDGEECELSHRLQASLRQLGYTNTTLLANGWTVWRQAGLPTAQGGPP
jgi:rhodanese-related sulfurtransferase